MGKTIPIVLGTLVLMVVCGAVTLFLSILLFIELGLRWHDNYEYYGQFWWSFAPAVVAFLMPALVVVFAMHGRTSKD